MCLLIKVCGLKTQADCDAAAGADFCGFIFHSPSPRNVTPEQAANLRTGSLRRVGVFVFQQARDILDVMRQAKLEMAQLHGNHDRDCARVLGAALGHERIIRVLWPAQYPDMAALEADMNGHAQETGLFLLDAGSGGGGSGTALNWNLLQISSPRPWLLAGGLTPNNVDKAVRACAPDGVDLNSGLESAVGHKDPQLIRKALTVLRGNK